MLKAMVFENFVRFKDRFSLDFSKGKDKPHFFIGASSTGKTAVLELIRRCLKPKLNTSLTNRFDVTKTAYAFCEFEVKDDENIFGPDILTRYIIEGENNRPNKDQTTTLLEEKGDKKEDLPKDEAVENESEDGKDGMNHKLKKEDCLHGIQDRDGMEMNRNSNQGVEDDQKEEREETAEESIDEKEIPEGNVIFHKIIIYKSIGGVVRVRSKTFFKHEENIFDSKKNVKIPTDGQLKVLNDVRKLQLSRLQINQEFVEEVLKKIRNKQSKRDTYKRYPKLWDQVSETYVGILSMRGVGTFQWTRSDLIAEENKRKNYTEVCKQTEIINDLLESPHIDSEEEEKAFRFITNPSLSKFVKKGDEIVVKQGDDKEFPLLKTSVGIIEAKQFSLVISDKRFKTICYEEPDRGMHPQMIERLREVLDQRKRNSENGEFGLTSLASNNLSPKVSQIPADEDLKKLLFSSRVLLVEGKSDKVVIDAIFRYTSANQEARRKAYQILSHQIIQLGGSDKASDVQDVCKEIQLPCSILRDRDTRVNVYGDLFEGIKDFPDFEDVEFKERSIGEFMADANGFKKLSEDLEKRDEFIWKHGDLEDFLLSEKCYRPKIIDTLNVKENEKSRRKDIKSAVKKKLRKGLSQEQSDKLGNILSNFKETERLLEFLERE